MSEKKNDLELSIGGKFELNTLKDQLGYAQNLIREGMVSSTFKTPQQLVIGIQLAKSLSIDPAVALGMMYVIKGKPSLFGDGPLSLIKRSPLYGGAREFYVDKDINEICFKNKNLNAEVYAAVIQIKRTGFDEIQEDFFTVDDMNKAGVHLNKYGEKDTWKKYLRIMLRYRARSLAIKSLFPDLLNGINISEHMDNFTPEVPEINNPNQKENDASEITKTLTGTDDAVVITIDDQTTIDKGESQDYVKADTVEMPVESKVNVVVNDLIEEGKISIDKKSETITSDFKNMQNPKITEDKPPIKDMKNMSFKLEE